MMNQLKSWLFTLSDRERYFLMAGSVVVSILFFYVVLWCPLSNSVADNKKQFRLQKQRLIYLQTALQNIQMRKAAGIQITDTSSFDLLALVEQTITQEQLSAFVKQVQQPQPKEMLVTFEQVSFQRLMRWLQVLATTYGVCIKRFSAERLPISGTVNATVVLSQ